MRIIGPALRESQMSPLLQNLQHIGEVSGEISQFSGMEFTTGGIDRYIAATGTDCDKTWDSVVEIMVLYIPLAECSSIHIRYQQWVE